MTAHNQAFGRFGEEAAAQWYLAAGYRILDRNWRCARGEIDLVVADNNTLVFAEVKARTTTRFGSGFDAVDRRKQARVRQVAAHWLSDHQGDPLRSGYFTNLRFDAVDVNGNGTVDVRAGCF
jgi:putative endonuclease